MFYSVIFAAGGHNFHPEFQSYETVSGRGGGEGEKKHLSILLTKL